MIPAILAPRAFDVTPAIQLFRVFLLDVIEKVWNPLFRAPRARHDQ